ncbi:hypothetical protein [Paenibacillus qinlingensis]|uniref:EAL domain-containing protein (Putative c-di-GMP-specific phosphodiesterase class I) n=1 Tax=Paenibacillus qinlingensis TaxID=1837343 RepID=A0ABU1NU56_9BACL|nr:hypothetical protein [Paenibacillus qinlingensis]MDR6551026.1 EAL domain-containing protein (putative c-di-GMP-specific phosphodiesterase class I) [Paenibacillus qinlingensis]
MVQLVADILKETGLHPAYLELDTKEQFELLKNGGCNEMQGYVFSKLLYTEDMTVRLANTFNAR